MEEEWRPIKDYEGLYSVSNLGRVRSEARLVKGKGDKFRPIKEKFLSPNLDWHGYFRVLLYREGKRKVGKVHRLVAIAFIDNPEKHVLVLHGANGQTDNSVSNLYWGNQKQNIADRQRDGTCHETNKTHCPQGHEYSEKNTYINPNDQHRKCRSCTSARHYLRSRPDSTETLQEISDRFYIQKYKV